MRQNEDEILQALETLSQNGISDLCHPAIDIDPYIRRCSLFQQIHHHVRRRLDDLQEPVEVTPPQWQSLLMAILCLSCAAICAGLIMGIMSIDELMLHIKIRAGSDAEEQKYAQTLLPLVQKRHLVLVSLLLVNFLADEALPLFLDNLVPTWLAVALSVFLVVFVSEILPSAIFIGPDQLKLAARVSPFCYFVIYLVYPIAFPISKLLDLLLQAEDDLGNLYNRGELAAMVRIKYESRLAAKRRELEERRLSLIENPEDDDLSDLPSYVCPTDDTLYTMEVNVVEGAFNLKTTTARDVCTKLRNAYTIPHDMVLDQQNVARIYGVGYSRVPVYLRNPRRPRDPSAIIGILMTRQLIMIDTDHRRKVGSLPLYIPTCISPNDNMIDLLHIFQSGSMGNKGGHMAIVCEKPTVAQAALERHHPIPPEAKIIGIVTLEDVIEELIQEPIYDEGDRKEREAMERAVWAWTKWRIFVKRRRKQRDQGGLGASPSSNVARLSEPPETISSGEANEEESLLNHDIEYRTYGRFSGINGHETPETYSRNGDNETDILATSHDESYGDYGRFNRLPTTYGRETPESFNRNGENETEALSMSHENGYGNYGRFDRLHATDGRTSDGTWTRSLEDETDPLLLDHESDYPNYGL